MWRSTRRVLLQAARYRRGMRPHRAPAALGMVVPRRDPSVWRNLVAPELPPRKARRRPLNGAALAGALDKGSPRGGLLRAREAARGPPPLPDDRQRRSPSTHQWHFLIRLVSAARGDQGIGTIWPSPVAQLAQPP